MFKKFNKDESGAALVIEMTLIFPLVLLVVTFLIYTAFYVLQGVTMYNSAQQIAVIATREAQCPGYLNIYSNTSCEIGGKIDFGWKDNYTISKTTVDSVADEHNPYRYFAGESFINKDDKETLETALESLVSKTSFLSNSTVDCKIKTNNNFLYQNVFVELEKKVNAPKMFEAIGLNDALDIKVTAVAVVSDPGEFVRNTDVVCDLADFLWNDLKFGDSDKSMGERVAIFKQKVTDMKAKFNF